MLESQTRPSFPPAPPPVPEPKRRRNVVVIAAAIGVCILLLVSVIWLMGETSGDPQPKEVAESDVQTAPLDTSPNPITSPSSITSPGPSTSPIAASDRSRALAIIAEAHSGKYFSNRFEDTYPKQVEVAMVMGMIGETDSDPLVTDALLACTLSYVETHVSFTYLAKHAKEAERLGFRAGLACLDRMNP